MPTSTPTIKNVSMTHSTAALDDIQLINHKTLFLLEIQKRRLISGEVSIFEEVNDLPEDYKKGKFDEQIDEINAQIENALLAIKNAEELREELT